MQRVLLFTKNYTLPNLSSATPKNPIWHFSNKTKTTYLKAFLPSSILQPLVFCFDIAIENYLYRLMLSDIFCHDVDRRFARELKKSV